MLGSFFVIFRSWHILEPPPQPPISPQDSKVACREVTCQCHRNSTVLSRPAASSALNENEIFAAVMSQKCQICISHHICSVAKKTSRFLVFWTPGWANVVYFQLKLVYVWETVWGAAVEILRMFSGFWREAPHLQRAQWQIIHIVSGFTKGTLYQDLFLVLTASF